MRSWLHRARRGGTGLPSAAPTKLSTAEIATATFGFSTPVAIEVAIAFAVSRKPFVKSNARAVTITTTNKNSDPLVRAIPSSQPPK